MIKYEGTTRNVFIIGPLAFKVAKVRLLKAILSLSRMLLTKKWKDLYKNLFIYRPQECMTVPFLLLGGIYANIEEFLFFWQSQHPFLQPTLFSFFGILNIQIAGRQNTQNYWEFFVEIIEGSDQCHPLSIRHTFYNAHNFCRYKNSLKIIDYADKEVQKIIQLHGNKMMAILKNSN